MHGPVVEHPRICRAEDGRSGSELDEANPLLVRVDGKDINVVARLPEHILEICDVILRLLAASVVHSIFLRTWRSEDHRTASLPALAYLMEQCQSLKVLKLSDIALDANHCRVLGTYSTRSHIQFISCELRARAIAVEVLAQSGPDQA
jgi:hypothetical protein